VPKLERPDHTDRNYEAVRQRARRSHAYWAERLKLRAADEIARLMEEEGVSRSELARKMGNAPSFVTKILRGEHNFSFDTFSKVGIALGYTWEISPVKLSARMTSFHFIEKAAVTSPQTEDCKYTEREREREVARADQLAA